MHLRIIIINFDDYNICLCVVISIAFGKCFFGEKILILRDEEKDEREYASWAGF